MKTVYETAFLVPTGDTSPSGDMSIEDGGQAIIVDADHDSSTDGPSEFFVRLHSWHRDATKDDQDSHPLMRSLMGKRVRVTVEVID